MVQDVVSAYMLELAACKWVLQLCTMDWKFSGNNK